MFVVHSRSSALRRATCVSCVFVEFRLSPREHGGEDLIASSLTSNILASLGLCCFGDSWVYLVHHGVGPEDADRGLPVRCVSAGQPQSEGDSMHRCRTAGDSSEIHVFGSFAVMIHCRRSCSLLLSGAVFLHLRVSCEHSLCCYIVLELFSYCCTHILLSLTEFLVVSSVLM